MNKAETGAWNRFIARIRDMAGREGDGCVPVALIALPGTVNEDNTIDVEARDARILWKASIPPALRGAILRGLGKEYEENRVILEEERPT